jgi:channel protein (hemolysin III family)
VYYTERFNGISHLVGAVLAVAGAIALAVAAASTGDARKIVGVGVYGGTLVVLYTVSTLYHSLRGRTKTVFAATSRRAAGIGCLSSAPRRARLDLPQNPAGRAR